MKLSDIMNDETIIATFKVSIVKPLSYLISGIIVTGVILAYAFFGVKPSSGLEFNVTVILAGVVGVIFIYYIVSNFMMRAKTVYRLTNQRVIIDEYSGFRAYNCTFNYKVIKEVEITKVPLCNYNHVRFIVERANKYKETYVDNVFYALNKKDTEMVIECLNKYSKAQIVK